MSSSTDSDSESVWSAKATYGGSEERSPLGFPRGSGSSEDSEEDEVENMASGSLKSCRNFDLPL